MEKTYKKKVYTSNPCFHGRKIVISTGTTFKEVANDPDPMVIEVDDDTVLCNGCNENICDMKDTTEEAKAVKRQYEAGEISKQQYEEKMAAIQPYGWFIYFGEEALEADTPYDVYCTECVKECFPDAETVEQ